MIRRSVTYRGTVQGVGFRWTAVRTASGFAVTGTVRNMPDGSVELVAEGDPDEVKGFLAAVAERMSGHIRGVQVTEGVATGQFTAFDLAW